MAKKKNTNSSSYSFSPRIINIRKVRKRILIVCEGETEEKYFKTFQVLGRDTKTATIQPISIDIKNAKAVSITVVRKAIKLKKCDGSYNDDEVWCVFDRDAKKENNNQQNFNQAIEFAHNNQINLAISNDAFELWFLLHYEYYCSQTHRIDLNKLLTNRLGQKYEKNDDTYNQLEDKQENAIKNAKKLWLSHCQENQYKSDNLSVHEKQIIHNINPSTTIYQLIEKLREVIGILVYNEQ